MDIMTKKNKRKFIEAIIILIIAFFTIYYEDFTEKTIEDEVIQNRNTEEVIKISDGDKLNVYYLDVGQADSILIENNNKYMLIDAGNNEDGEKLVTYFKRLGITKFDIVVGTHAHEDHIGGMDDIINNFEIEDFYMPEVITTTKTFEDVLDALEVKQVAFQTPIIDSELVFENSKIKVLSVSDEDSDLNDTSIVLRLKYGTTSFLFTGDATEKIENTILNKEIKSDVLKVAHHGSSTSNSLSFLKRVSPTYAVISVGEGNSYNHPHDVILNRLYDLNARVYRTDRDGTVVASSNGTLIDFSMIDTNTDG